MYNRMGLYKILAGHNRGSLDQENTHDCGCLDRKIPTIVAFWIWEKAIIVALWIRKIPTIVALWIRKIPTIVAL